MNGIQNEWKETRKTEKMFTTLPPGEYTFQVLAKNENGIWSEETAKTSFNIKKPYWKTWWFISVITAVCILVFYLIFHFRFKLVRRKKQLIQDINNYKQIVLRQQMNPHFLFNTLNSIQYYLLDNDTHSSLAYLSKFARLMRKILDNSQQTYISIQDEVNTLKLYLDLEQIRLDNSFRYGINVDDSLNLEENKIPSLLLQPYVENSIHHGLRYKENSDGYIEININKQKEHIKFTIKDNGIGRKKAEEINKRKSREKTPLGSKITEDRIKTLNALYHENILINYEDIKSQNNTIQGTKVEIFIPVTFYSKAQN
jgi:LytS/YehU family sensor histidine kinase